MSVLKWVTTMKSPGLGIGLDGDSVFPSPDSAQSQHGFNEVSDSLFRGQAKQATLKLKLVVLLMGKQMPHHNVMRHPTTAQLDHSMVLATTAMAPWWTERTWLQWCAELKPGAKTQRPVKSSLSLKEQRQQQRELVRTAALKRPAASKMPRKRTPFTRQREGYLRQSGVGRTIYKQKRPPGLFKKPAAASRRKR